MMDDKFRSRKFLLAVASLIVSAIALLVGIISGGEWVACITAILGLYGVANVAGGYKRD